MPSWFSIDGGVQQSFECMREWWRQGERCSRTGEEIEGNYRTNS